MIAHALLVLLSAGDWKNLIQRDGFAGWRSPSGKTPLEGAWEIRGGVLSVKPFVQHRTDLWSVDEYGDFELEWEWRADRAANSGVKYWVQSATTLIVIKEDQEWKPIADPSLAPGETTLEYSRGLEYQMADDAHEPDALKRPAARAGGLYGQLPPQPENAKPHGQWNRSRLIVKQGHVEHWLNGRRVLAYDVVSLPPRVRLDRQRGPLALQYHQTRVSFRRMRIRAL